MTWIEESLESGIKEVNLHGYSVETAMEVARAVIAEAYENGVPYVRLIHGYNTSRPRTYPYGAPTIKEELLRLLAEGIFVRHAYSKNSRRHQRRAGFIILAIRPNPSPNPHPIWSSPPAKDYSG